MFGHPNNVAYNKKTMLYDWKDKFNIHMVGEDIVVSCILAGVMLIPFALVSIF